MTRNATSSAPTSCTNRRRRTACCSATSKHSRSRPPRAACAGCGMPIPIRSSSERTTSPTVFAAAKGRGTVATFFPHQIERELTFLPYAQISEFTLEHRIHVTEAFYVPHGPAFDRAVSFVVDVTLYNPGRDDAGGRRSSRGRCWSASVSTASPSTKCALGTTGASSARGISKPAASAGGAVRVRRSPSSSRCASRCCSNRCAARRLVRDEEAGVPGDVTPDEAELVSRRIFGAFEYPHLGGRRRARVAAPGGRLP